MALLSFPSSPFHFFSTRSVSRRPSLVCSFSASTNARSRSAILWFKHDLRLHDHPGLAVAAQTQRFILPLYVFDHRILSRYSDDMLELLLFALEDLRNSLKEQGSNLMVRFGSAENIIKELVKEVKATDLFIEEEVEYEMRQLIGVVKETLEMSSSLDGNLEIVVWRTPFYDIKELKELPASYNDFKKLKLLPTSPPLPATLPVAETELHWGPLPTFSDLRDFIKERIGKSKVSWNLMKGKPAEAILKENFSKPSGTKPKSLNAERKQRRLDKSVFITRKGDIVGGGTNSVLNALAAYLRYLEGTARDDWQEVHERLRNAETREGASFTSLFGPALCLGIISRRTVYYEAIKYEKERNAGFLSPFGYSAASVAAAVDAVCSMEWFLHLALKSQLSNEGLYSIRIWRWRGHLIQYTVVGHEGPAILLVHGFGAFLEHYRDNINGIAERGNRVWAITLLGFGKSEKPNIVYTELLWAELLRDFIIEVVGEPVHPVGNSIGGYFVSIVAGLWPALVKSVILMNSAGSVIPGFSSRQSSNERQSLAAAGLVAQLLLFYLRLNIRNTIKSFYPTKTDRADDWLINEMLRAVSSSLLSEVQDRVHTLTYSSYDPGVIVVLESIFTFDLSIPLNYLLERYEGRVLILQGMKDPLLDSKAKLAMLKEHCTGLVIKELDAGHCPHDEQPQEVNRLICEWIAAVERKLTANSYS